MTAPGPDRFPYADDVDQAVEDARAALELLPRDEQWEQAAALLDRVREEGEAHLAPADPPLLAALAAHQAARHAGSDGERVATVVLDAAGRLVDLVFGDEAARSGADGIAAAVRAAWAEAETHRLDASLAFAEQSAASGAGLDTAAPYEGELRRVQHAIQTDIDARRHDRFQRTTGDGLFTAEVDLIGALVGLVCHTDDVGSRTDRDTLARGLAAVVEAAQAEGTAVIAAICERHYRELE